MTDQGPAAVVLKYVECINKGQPDDVAALTAQEFTFTDSSGRVYVFRGKKEIKRCWREYFTPFPNYKIRVQQVLRGGDGVALIGQTNGSHVPAEIEEKSTVLWIATVRGGLVAEWRIYADEEYVQG